MQRKMTSDRRIALRRQDMHNKGGCDFEEDDDMDLSHVSLDTSILDNSIISGLTLEASLLTDGNTAPHVDQCFRNPLEYQKFDAITPSMYESHRNTLDYYTIEEECKNVAFAIEKAERERKFHDLLSQMNHLSASIDVTMLTNKSTHQHQQLGTLTETKLRSTKLERGHDHDEKGARSLVISHATDPRSLESNFEEYMKKISSDMREIPVPTPPKLQHQVSHPYIKQKSRYSSQTISANEDSVANSMDTPITHQISVSTCSTTSKRTINISKKGKLPLTPSPSHSLKKKLRHDRNEKLQEPTAVTPSPQHSFRSSAGAGAQNFTQKFSHHLTRNKSPASNRPDSTSRSTTGKFGDAYIMESPTSSKPSVDSSPRRTVPHDDEASFDQPCAPTRAHSFHLQYGLMSNGNSMTSGREMIKEWISTGKEEFDLPHSSIFLENKIAVAKGGESSSKIIRDVWVSADKDEICVKEMVSMGSEKSKATSKGITDIWLPRTKEGRESAHAIEKRSMGSDSSKAPAKIITEVWVPMGNEGDITGFTEFPKAMKSKKDDKKHDRDGTAATRQRDIKFDVMKRLADEQVRDPEKLDDATDTPVLSMENIMRIPSDDDVRVPITQQIRKVERSHPAKTTSPEAFASSSRPMNATQLKLKQNQPGDDMKDQDIELGAPSCAYPTSQVQRMMTAYSSVESIDTLLSDDGIHLLQVERDKDRHRLDKLEAKINSKDLAHAYAVEVPRHGDKVRHFGGKSMADRTASTNTSYRRKRWFLGFVAALLTAAVAAIGFLLFTRKANTGDPTVPSIEATSPSGSPTFSRDELQDLILTLSPDTKIPLQHETPQREAFNWLISPVNDAYFSDHRRLLQRFALAVFFYSTGGPRWSSKLGWMTSDSECTWKFTSSTDPCDSDGNIIWIDMRENALVGDIPVEISSLLPFIRGIDLSGNQLFEVFPVHLQQLSVLEFYFVEENDSTGIIPSEIGLMTNLQFLSLPQNRLKGPIPTEIGRLTNLKHIEFSKNSLTGILPSEVGLLRNVQTIDIGFNQINGTLPVQIQSLFALESLTLSMNLLTGSIPTVYGYLVALTSLSMDFNNLTSRIPSDFGKLTALKTLWLQTNFIDGTIPVEVGLMNNLTWLDISQNLLDGKIPEEIGYLQKLEVLNLQENNLQAKIPRSLGNSTALTKILLRGNHFTGTIPGSLGRLFLSTLDLASNQLSGQIPEELVGGIANAASLNLSGNNMTGSVPVGLCNFLATNKGLLEVDCVEVICDASCCPSCAFQNSGGIFGG